MAHEGSYKNIKITTPEDLEIGEIFAREIFGKKIKMKKCIDILENR